jgi:hypothetical protein
MEYFSRRNTSLDLVKMEFMYHPKDWKHHHPIGSVLGVHPEFRDFTAPLS